MTATGSFRPALLLALWVLPACTTWEPQLVPVAVVVEAAQPGRIRVISHGQPLILSHPSIRGDSLVGASPTGDETVALADVTAVWVHRTNPVAALVGIPLTLGIGIMALFAAYPY